MRVNGEVDYKRRHVRSGGPDLRNDSLGLRPLVLRLHGLPLIQGINNSVNEILLFA